MKDVYKPLRKRLHKMAQQWQPLFGLTEYDIAFKWWTEGWPHSATSVMHVTASWAYKWATLDVNMPIAITRTRTEIEGDLLHEIGHILCAVLPMKPAEDGMAPPEEERFVTDLAQCVQRIAKEFYAAGEYHAGQQASRPEPEAPVRIERG